MTTIDKINSELTQLQDELGKLQHYTQEIGMAKDASSAVVEGSKKFVAGFQTNVNELSKQMKISSDDFSNRCSEAGGVMDRSSASFKREIDDSKATLELIGLELSSASSNVSDLTKRIEEINILGHFERIHIQLEEISSGITDFGNKVGAHINQIANQQKKANFKSFVSQLVTLIITASILVFLLLKK